MCVAQSASYDDRRHAKEHERARSNALPRRPYGQALAGRSAQRVVEPRELDRCCAREALVNNALATRSLAAIAVEALQLDLSISKITAGRSHRRADCSNVVCKLYRSDRLD